MTSPMYIKDDYFPNQVIYAYRERLLELKKVNGLVKTDIEIPSTRPNQLDLGDKNSKMQAKGEIRECDCC